MSYLKTNVYEVSYSGGTAIAKYARFGWEIGYYQAETEAYSWLEGHGIRPRFLGHLKEEDRIIGFLLEKVQGRHATIQDLVGCEEVYRNCTGWESSTGI